MYKNKSILSSVFVFLCFIVFYSLTGFTSGVKKIFTIQFENYVSNELLKLDDATYKNGIGQTYTVSKFKYYISSIQLLRKEGKPFTSHEYFLVDQELAASKIIALNTVPDGEYTGIRFTVGIDSLHNCSGLQKGALDPVKGMFWAWNTGYIFLKFDGHSPQSISSGNSLEYHIGGFQQPHNCIRTITLPFAKHMIVSSDNGAIVKIKTDVSKLFNSHSLIDFSKMSAVTNINNSTLVADNYANLFSIAEIR